MAEAAEITPSEESLMSEKLSIGKVEYDVNLTTHALKFTKYQGKTHTPKDRIIQLEDIITILLSSEAADPSLTLCFIEKKSSTLRYTKTIFKGKDLQTCKNVADQVLQAVQLKASNRPRKMLVIVNPKSGSNKGQKIYDKQVVPILQLAGVEIFPLITQRSGHAKEYIQDFDLSQVDGVMVIGGDGTLAEVIHGLYRRRCRMNNININDPDVTLPPLGIKVAIIPAGTGQGIAMIAYGTYDVETAILTVIQGKAFQQSVYTCHNAGKCLLVGDLIVSHGFFSCAIEHSEAKRNLGKVRYGVGLGKALMKLPRFTAEIQYKLAKPVSEKISKETEVPIGAADGLGPDWESVTGEFTDVIIFVTMGLQLDENLPPGTTALHMVDTRSRMQYTKFATKLLVKMQPVHDLDFVTCKYIDAFKIILHNVPREGHPAQGEGQGQQQGTEGEDQKPVITVLNLDGDPFPVTDKLIHVKMHGNVLELFGSKPENWKDGLVKKMMHT